MNTQRTALEIYQELLDQQLLKTAHGNPIHSLNIIQQILDKKVQKYPQYLFEFYNKMSSVPEWSREKGLVPETSDQESIKMALQILKTGEEFGELCSSFLRNEDKKFEDSIGDVLFTITVLCAQKNKNPFLIFNEVFEEVLKRKGKHNGKSFVKEEELKKEVSEPTEIIDDLGSNNTISFPAEKEDESVSFENQVKERLMQGNVYAKLKGGTEFNFPVISIDTETNNLLLYMNKKDMVNEAFLCPYEAIDDLTNK